MSSPDNHGDGSTPGEEKNTEWSTGALRRWPFAVWMALMTGLLIWFAEGSVSTTSYSYNQFIQTTFRNVGETSLQHIWSYQTQHLPTARMQWALDAVFVVAIVTVVASFVAGSWLLLVRASDHPASPRRRGRRFLHDHPA